MDLEVVGFENGHVTIPRCFLEESKEHLGNLNEQLLNLEKPWELLAARNEIFRAVNIKGMSSTMDLKI